MSKSEVDRHWLGSTKGGQPQRIFRSPDQAAISSITWQKFCSLFKKAAKVVGPRQETMPVCLNKNN